ncbi:MAG TPA: cardiolipin synthase ClsB [Methylophilaceae bacterium]|nr:cardiolipin synthase ClsB [Methylophilaceae bacterium]
MNHYIDGNHITLLRNGTEFFPALEAAINAAQYEVHVQTYIYAEDETGIRIGNALKNAAKRGVIVNLMLDGFGSKDLSKGYVQELEEDGVTVLFFRPKISPWTLKRNRLRRLHRKVSVIDGAVAFVGGINIIDDQNCPGNNAPRVDYAVRVEGMLVSYILGSARSLWRRISWAHLNPAHSSWVPKPVLPDTSLSMRAMFVVRDNVLHRRDIEQAYMRLINKASYEIIIASAYFVPGRKFRQALLMASNRGVKVKLLLQGRMENMLMIATHAFYSDFLRHGIEIYEYKKSFMHSKVAVVDDQWATVGSSNMDPFSLLLAREANVFVDDKQFATELRQDLDLAIDQGAVQIRPEDWEHGHIFKRTLSWVVFSLVRFILGVVGYPKNH